jgi:hypothetical protein
MSNTGTRALQDIPQGRESGQRKRDRAYRREMRIRHNRRLTRIIHSCPYKLHKGYVEWGLADGRWQPVGRYIKYPKNSNAQRYWKRQSNKAVRRRKEIFPGNQYRKCFEYWWMLS